MDLNIITPVTRPQNLPKMRDSIAAALRELADWKAIWWVCFDATHVPADIEIMVDGNLETRKLATPSVKDGQAVSASGNAQRNMALEASQSGWVYFLDDDTVLHPNLLSHISSPCHENPKISVVVTQTTNNGSVRLVAAPENMHLCAVDSGQVVMCRETIGSRRWRPMHYESDGYFIEEVYQSNPSSFVFINVGLSIYNALR